MRCFTVPVPSAVAKLAVRACVSVIEGVCGRAGGAELSVVATRLRFPCSGNDNLLAALREPSLPRSSAALLTYLHTTVCALGTAEGMSPQVGRAVRNVTGWMGVAAHPAVLCSSCRGELPFGQHYLCGTCDHLKLCHTCATTRHKGHALTAFTVPATQPAAVCSSMGVPVTDSDDVQADMVLIDKGLYDWARHILKYSANMSETSTKLWKMLWFSLLNFPLLATAFRMFW